MTNIPVALAVVWSLAAPPAPQPKVLVYPNDFGRLGTYSTNVTGVVDFNNPFFKPLGTNGRSCATCHSPDQAWTVSPRQIQKVFERTKGRDPLFNPVDGTNSPNADRSTLEARRAASSLLLNKGLIRVGMALPPDAEFEVVAVNDPYGNATATELSVFRRPLPSVNAAGFVEVMWDGRQSPEGRSLLENLVSQAGGAVLGHAQGLALPPRDTLVSIAAFQIELIAGQYADKEVGTLNRKGAIGGTYSVEVGLDSFFPGVNDPFAPGFDSDIFPYYDAWETIVPNPASTDFASDVLRVSVARGQAIFNERNFQIRDLPGINGPLDASQDPVTATCGTCHNAPGVGSSSLSKHINYGLARPGTRNADLPQFTLRRAGSTASCDTVPLPADCVQTTDPGRALVTGRWADVGEFKVPGLRGLAARPPYFHGGSHPDLASVVGFYDFRFQLGLTPEERADLVMFLRTL